MVRGIVAQERMRDGERRGAEADGTQTQSGQETSSNGLGQDTSGESRNLFSRMTSNLARGPILPLPLSPRIFRRADNVQRPKTPGSPAVPLPLPSPPRSQTQNQASSLSAPVPMAGVQHEPPQPHDPTAFRATHTPPPPSIGVGPGSNYPALQLPGYSNDVQGHQVVQRHQDHADQAQDVERGVTKVRPQRFLLCFPRVRSRRIRAQAVTTLGAGVFLASLLAVYLGLALTNYISRGEITIMIVLVILSATVFFCYSVIRLCVLVSRGDRARRRRQPPEMMGPGGYVVPTKPIQVVIVRDEEVADGESEAPVSQPPAYGLWRESVRVDPDRFFWQRSNAADAGTQRPETRSGTRPPSYASDDGISYVVEARPRSIVPSPHAHVASGSPAVVGPVLRT